MSISDLQNDTSAAPTKSDSLSLHSEQLRQPFSRLVEFIEATTKLQSFPIHNINDNALFLNSLCSCLHGSLNSTLPSSVPITFTNHQVFEEDNRYYEQIIFETKQVPTRPNWHDFFNGLIWCQFPKTKLAFNAQHVAEITKQGNTKRTSVRDRLTHFDECGIVLFTTQNKLQEQLQSHLWHELFVNNSAKWHQQTIPIIFGHALWEMLLSPFIGLTAKATVIEISDELMASLHAKSNTSEFYAICDDLLNTHISQRQLINTNKPWFPLPLLGIPQWSPFEQTDSFYNNKQYFMPKRA